MTCINCQEKIERALNSANEVIRAGVSLSEEAADIEYDDRYIPEKELVEIIEGLGYKVLLKGRSQSTDIARSLCFIVIILSLYFLLQSFGILNRLVPGSLAETGMGYGMLFVIGLITSVHCIAMCGGMGKKFTGPVMKAGAVLVVVMGLCMLTQGVNLSGISSAGPKVSETEAIAKTDKTDITEAEVPEPESAASIVSEAAEPESDVTEVPDPEREDPEPKEDETGETEPEGTESKDTGEEIQIVNSTLSPGTYPDITVKKGIPVRWNIDAPEGSVNGCNYVMVIPAYSIEHSFDTRDNVIEFVPEEKGVVQYTCWMGVIRGTINVTDD